jgi:dihydroflavonol-4-reductase
MKIFITGATGFIGTHLVLFLKNTQHELYCLARSSSNIETLEKVNANVIIGDVIDKQSVLDGMNGCDWVINLANFYEFWTPYQQKYEEVNIKGTRNVMEAAIASGVSKVVHVSTAVVYGNAEWPVTETSKMGDRCVTSYAQSKRDGDRNVWELYEKENLPLIVIYPSAVLGPNDPKASGRYILNMAQGKLPAQILTNIYFSFVHVKDVALTIVKALEKESNIGEKYIVSAENHTWGELNDMISKISGTRLPFLTLPGWLAVFNSYLFSAIAKFIKKPPIWDMSVDQIAIMKQGFKIDGSKVEKELGITYTPVYDAIKEAIESFK